ncbi:MAG: hypothetical protein NTW50_00770 [Candidatus Berkelbacteria bacterium]|nr:hypothetical protein [Candidatus Berkelbacteria bacterium]
MNFSLVMCRLFGASLSILNETLDFGDKNEFSTASQAFDHLVKVISKSGLSLSNKPYGGYSVIKSIGMLKITISFLSDTTSEAKVLIKVEIAGDEKGLLEIEYFRSRGTIIAKAFVDPSLPDIDFTDILGNIKRIDRDYAFGAIEKQARIWLQTQQNRPL